MIPKTAKDLQHWMCFFHYAIATEKGTATQQKKQFLACPLNLGINLPIHLLQSKPFKLMPNLQKSDFYSIFLPM